MTKKTCNNCKYFSAIGDLDVFEDDVIEPDETAKEGWCMAPTPAWVDDDRNDIKVSEKIAKHCPMFKRRK